MASRDEKMDRVRALLSTRDDSGRQLLRQVTHDINGPLFAFTLDLDLVSEALADLKAAVEGGDDAGIRAALESAQRALVNLQSANCSASEYVRDVQALAEAAERESR